jgi:hypothetical protein
MGAVANREKLIRDLVRLRRAEASAPESPDLLAVRETLEELVGSSVSRALAARVLGVSQTALDRRIRRGDVSVVPTDGGRWEVPVRALVDLAEAVEALGALPGGAQSALGVVLDERRRDAAQLERRDILPRRYLRTAERHGHRRAELQTLAYHRAVARRLTPRMVRDAKQRLARWRKGGKVDERYAQAWERLLDEPLPTVARMIVQDSQRGRDLRQNSPFAGALNQQERRRVLDVVEAP